MNGIGSVVFYGCEGVYEIVSIDLMAMNGTDDKVPYYTLSSTRTKGDVIYAPATTGKMRPIVSKLQAEYLLECVPHMRLEVLLENDPHYPAEYCKNVRIYDCKELLKIALFLHAKQKQSQADLSCLKMAKRYLTDELSATLDQTVGDMQTLFSNHVFHPRAIG